ncbi:hypothetical protein J6590_032188 [Homalodisca vitripennis]|nr:hypothetical protein J6590_032188 [Homalodisca vitripennis]
MNISKCKYLPRSAIIRTQRPPVYYGPHLPEYYGEQRPPPDEQEPEPQGAAACTPPPPPQEPQYPDMPEPQYPDMPDFEAEYPGYLKRKHGTRQQYEQIKKIELDFRRENWIRKHKKADRIVVKKASRLPKNRVSLLPPNMQRKAAAAQSTAGTSGAAQQPPGNQGQGGARPKTKLSAPGTSGLKCRKPTTGTSRQQGAPGTSRGTGVPAGTGTGLRRPATGDNCREERRPMTGHDVDMDLVRGNIAPSGGPPPPRVCPPKQSRLSQLAQVSKILYFDIEFAMWTALCRRMLPVSFTKLLLLNMT